LALIFYFHSKCKYQIAQETAQLRQSLLSKHCTKVEPLNDLPVSTRFDVSCPKVAKNDYAEITLGQLKRLKAKTSNIGVSASWPDEAISNFISKNSCQGI